MTTCEADPRIRMRIWRNASKQLHRDDDLPAIEYEDGSLYWYRNNQRHRDNDLPAVVWANGTKMWYKNNKRHRDNDLPAVVWADGSCEWWVDNKHVRSQPSPDQTAKSNTSNIPILRWDYNYNRNAANVA